MSRILRRPMFRGGRVDGRGTGIASGLGYNNGGRVGLETGGNPIMARGGLGGQRPTPTGGSIMSRIRNLPYLGRMIPAMGGTAGAIGSQVVLPATIGAGLGSLADFYAKSTSTPEGYRRLKEMGGANFNFDETNLDVGEVLEYIDEGNEIGEAPGFFPRGGKEKWYKEHGYNSDGTPIVEEDIIEGETKTENEKEKALRLEKEDLLAQLEAFMNPKELTEDEKLSKIEKNKAMIQKAYGSGRGDDASAMLLNFAGKALKPEATVKSAFGEFFEEEGKRPSERKKYKDAATTAAINAFLTGEKTLAEVEAWKEKSDWSDRNKLAIARESKNWDTYLIEGAGTGGDPRKMGAISYAVSQMGEELAGVLPELEKGQTYGEILEEGPIYVQDSPDGSFKILVKWDGEKLVPIKQVYKR